LRNIDAEGSWLSAGNLGISAAFRQQGYAARSKKRFQHCTSRHLAKRLGFHVQLLAIPVWQVNLHDRKLVDFLF
jgi:hypothetical protein